MNINQIVSIVVACIVSAGGVGGIVVAVVRWSSDMIASRLEAKYENRLQREMEKYKTELNKKEYVSKIRFDTEFGIYRELSQAFCEMVKDVSIMIPSGLYFQPADDEARRKYEDECYEKANNSVVKAQDALYSNAAFIPQEFFSGFEQIIKLCKRQLFSFGKRYNVSYIASEKEKRTLDDKDYERTEDINKMWTEHVNKIRKYLSTLDVM